MQGGQHGGMFFHYSSTHIANILLHICGASVAMAAGLLAIVSGKRGRLHRWAGRAFVWGYGVVLFTAVMGVAVFEFRSFLAVATVASSYGVFSGYRAVRLRGRRPEAVDRLAAMVALAAPATFVAAMHVLVKPWAPVLTWTVLGGLLLMSGYDLLRGVLPATWLEATWVHEHLFKMIGAFDALTATFAGTVFPQFQPWSALVPNVAGTLLIAGFFVAGPRAWRGRRPRRMATEGDCVMQ